MVVKRFPIEEGHILMFARAIGDPNPVYTDREAAAVTAVGGIIAPPTFVQASAQFDPDYFLRPHDGETWFGSGATPSGTARATNERVRTPTEGSAGDVAEGSAGARPRGGGGSGLHAEQRFDYHKVLRLGDVLSAETRPGRRWERQGRRGGSLIFSEVVTEYRDEDGELVITATAVGVRTERVPDQGES